MLHHEITGEGPPVVLLHEGIVDSRSWNKVVPLARAAPHRRHVRPARVRAIAAPGRPVLARRGSRLGARRRRPRPRRARRHLAGRRIAIDFTLTHPERVDGAHPGRLGDVRPSHRVRRPHPTSSAGGTRRRRRGDLAALADIDLEVWAPLGVDPELRAMAVENVEWSNADDPGTWADPPAVGRLSEIRVPTLVITADATFAP